MKIVVPLAGRDKRFVDRFGITKPLVPLGDSILVRHVFDTLHLNYEQDVSEIHFIVHDTDVKEFDVQNQLLAHFPFRNTHVHVLSEPTEGAACTVLTIQSHLTSGEPVIVYLADVIFEARDLINQYLPSASPPSASVIPTFESENPNGSYVDIDQTGQVRKVAEKQMISRRGTTGFYHFASAKDFVWAAQEMIKDPSNKVRDAFFISPIYNQLVKRGDMVIHYPVMLKHWLSSPEDVMEYQHFLKTS